MWYHMIYMRIVKMSQNDPKAYEHVMREVSEAIQAGALVVFPSDTVYGLLADASNEEAVGKLIICKSRPTGKAISIFVNSYDMMRKYVDVSTETQLRLSQILPGPYTIVLPALHNTDSRLEAENKTLGVRIPASEPIIDLVTRVGRAVTATSANPAGRPPHYSVSTLLRALPQAAKDVIDIVVDGGILPYTKPSTVVDYSHHAQKVLRQGERHVGDHAQLFSSTSPEQTEEIVSAMADMYDTKAGKKPLVYLLRGELGAGKTVIAKSIARGYGVAGVVSPTYVISYEYPLPDDTKHRFVHVDLYNVQEESEYEHLGLADYLHGHNIMCIEWSEHLGSLLEEIRRHAFVVCIDIEHVSETVRTLRIYELPDAS